ncbi:MAG: radical SAM protein [Rikenellaceae bacterium]
MTKLHPGIIFGPVHSRRLGISLGVNLLPVEAKLCNFDCIYCECGWNRDNRSQRYFNDRGVVLESLEHTLEKMGAKGALPDVITFAGNGEPTLHPEFETIIMQTIALRDRLAPEAKISVLSNATTLHREDVCRALKMVDNNILKLDSAFESTVKAINKPVGNYSTASLVEQLKSFGGELIIQTMLLRGQCDGVIVDNTTEEEISAWLKLISEIKPKLVMLYSLDRDTPCPTIERVGREELLDIAARAEALGIKTSVA